MYPTWITPRITSYMFFFALYTWIIGILRPLQAA